MSSAPASFGERVAFHRRRRGLSQAALGGLMQRSESWVSQVERGVRKVDRMSVLASLAEALQVPVTSLTPEDVPAAVAGAPKHHVDILELALTGAPAPESLFSSDAPSRTDDLSEQVEEVWQLAHGSAYDEVAQQVARLVPLLESARRTGSARQRRQAVAQLVVIYQAASAVLAKTGEGDAAWVAADRAVRLAETLEDPLQVLAGQFRMTHAFLGSGRAEQARHVATTSAETLRSAPDRARWEPEISSLEGAFELLLAVLDAREGDRGGAEAHLAVARALADRVGPGRNDFETEFGPGNVAVHEVSLAVELGDAGHALELAGSLSVDGLSDERRARFLIDVARAQAQRRRWAEAYESLAEAERLAPQQVQDHPFVREVVRELALHADPHGSGAVADLARRVGALP